MDLENQFGLLQSRFESCVLASQLRHTRVLGWRIDGRFGGDLSLQQPSFFLLTPTTDQRGVQPFTAQDLTDLSVSCTGSDLLEKVTPVLLGIPSSDGAFEDLRIRLRGPSFELDWVADRENFRIRSSRNVSRPTASFRSGCCGVLSDLDSLINHHRFPYRPAHIENC